MHCFLKCHQSPINLRRNLVSVTCHSRRCNFGTSLQSYDIRRKICFCLTKLNRVISFIQYIVNRFYDFCFCCNPKFLKINRYIVAELHSLKRSNVFVFFSLPQSYERNFNTYSRNPYLITQDIPLCGKTKLFRCRFILKIRRKIMRHRKMIREVICRISRDNTIVIHDFILAAAPERHDASNSIVNVFFLFHICDILSIPKCYTFISPSIVPQMYVPIIPFVFTAVYIKNTSLLSKQSCSCAFWFFLVITGNSTFIRIKSKRICFHTITFNSTKSSHHIICSKRTYWNLR